MRDLFPGHYRPRASELEHLWTNALFVFDTNVLLNLYSYPEEAREIFFSVLQKVSDRVWIPYQVALEFHKNRFNRIRSSNEAVSELRDRIQCASADLERDFKKIEFEKRNTGINDIAERLSAVRSAYEGLSEALNAACGRLPGVSLEDPIGTRISELFSNKVGTRPVDQASLDELIKDGEGRYQNDIPPGYSDKGKGETYRDHELTYQGKFGDLILWRQTIEYVKTTGKRHVIFITGDRKKDWWDIDKGKTLGPRPELVHEFLGKSEASLFWMYSADQFLQFAEDYLQAVEVTAETIEQVRETADLQQYQGEMVQPSGSRSKWAQEAVFSFDDFGSSKVRLTDNGESLFRHWKRNSIHECDPGSSERISTIMPVLEWLDRRHPNGLVSTFNYPYLAIETEGDLYGYEIMSATDKRVLDHHLAHRSRSLDIGKYKEFSLIIVVSTLEMATRLSGLGPVCTQMAKMHEVDAVIFGAFQDGKFVAPN